MPLSSAVKQGFAASATYDTNRPSYAANAVAQILEVLEIKGVSNACVIDLAAGTGKFTEILAAQPENFNIIAVEPHPGMREQLVNKNLKNVTVVDGSAENMGTIEDSKAAAVVTAQAFHWFANMKALKEVHRVIRPTGVFCALWNIEDYQTPRGWKIHDGWETEMREQMWQLDDSLPRFRNEEWRKVFDEQSKGDPISLHMSDPLFGLPIGEASVDTEEWISKQALWGRFQTYSQIANLDEQQLKTVERIYWDAIENPKTELNSEGRVAVHGKVVWVWTSRIPGEPLQSGGRPDQ